MDNVRIWEDRNTIFWVKVCLILGASLLLLCIADRLGAPLGHFFGWFFTAIVLTAVMTPLARFMARFYIPRGITVVLANLAALALLGTVSTMVVSLVLEQGHALATVVPKQLPVWWSKIHDLIQVASPELADEMNAGIAKLLPHISEQLTKFAETVSGFVGSVISLSVDSLIVLVISFFLTVEDGTLKSMVNRWTPVAKRAEMGAMIDRIITEMAIWARAQLMLSLFFGVAFGTVLELLHVPYGFRIGFIGAVLDIIPYLGGAVAVALAMMMAFQESWMLGVAVFVAYFIIMEIEWHVLAPVLMDRYLHLRSVIIVIALAVFSAMMGILGSLLSIPLAIVLRAVADTAMPYERGPDEEHPLPRFVKPMHKSRWRPWRHWVYIRLHQKRLENDAPDTQVRPNGEDGNNDQQ